MLKICKQDVSGWLAAIRGMRNPMNSWGKSDSKFIFGYEEGDYICSGIDYGEEGTSISTLVPSEYKGCCVSIGPNDYKLMMNLAKAGSTDAKYRRMINVTCDISAPLYWWKEFDTYKVGTVANSCSTMHKIQSKPFELSDFSYEHLMDSDSNENAMLRAQISDANSDNDYSFPIDILCNYVIPMLEQCRVAYNVTKDKRYWWQMIQLLPSSYNQTRTVQMNYEVLAAIYPRRKNHKLDEWHTFCDWVIALPYSEFITLEGTGNGE